MAPPCRTHGHHRAKPVTATGQVSCPPLGRTQWPLTLLGRDKVDVLLVSRGNSLVLYRCLLSVAGRLRHEVEMANQRWRDEGLNPPLESFICSSVNSVSGIPPLSTGDTVMITLGADSLEFRLPGLGEDEVSSAVPYDSVFSLTAELDRNGFPQMVLQGKGVSFWGTLAMVDYQEAAQILSRLQGELARRPQAANHEIQPPNPIQGSAAERLAQLQAVRDQGLISDEEYEAKRRGILDSL